MNESPSKPSVRLSRLPGRGVFPLQNTPTPRDRFLFRVSEVKKRRTANIMNMKKTRLEQQLRTFSPMIGNLVYEIIVFQKNMETESAYFPNRTKAPSSHPPPSEPFFWSQVGLYKTDQSLIGQPHLSILLHLLVFVGTCRLNNGIHLSTDCINRVLIALVGDQLHLFSN